MRASLDTNVIIYLYQANMQNILFDVFKAGVFIYEQIRNIELEQLFGILRDMKGVKQADLEEVIFKSKIKNIKRVLWFCFL